VPVSGHPARGVARARRAPIAAWVALAPPLAVTQVVAPACGSDAIAPWSLPRGQSWIVALTRDGADRPERVDVLDDTSIRRLDLTFDDSSRVEVRTLPEPAARYGLGVGALPSQDACTLRCELTWEGDSATRGPDASGWTPLAAMSGALSRHVLPDAAQRCGNRCAVFVSNGVDALTTARGLGDSRGVLVAAPPRGVGLDDAFALVVASDGRVSRLALDATVRPLCATAGPRLRFGRVDEAGTIHVGNELGAIERLDVGVDGCVRTVLTATTGEPAHRFLRGDDDTFYVLGRAGAVWSARGAVITRLGQFDLSEQGNEATTGFVSRAPLGRLLFSAGESELGSYTPGGRLRLEQDRNSPTSNKYQAALWDGTTTYVSHSSLGVLAIDGGTAQPMPTSIQPPAWNRATYLFRYGELFVAAIRNRSLAAYSVRTDYCPLVGPAAHGNEVDAAALIADRLVILGPNVDVPGGPLAVSVVRLNEPGTCLD
jgi:hypothetical protein